MTEKDHEIGAHEAKTRLLEFLRKVAAGQRFTITQQACQGIPLVTLDADLRGAVSRSGLALP